MAKVNLTPGRISALKCESGQSFLWDSDTPGLGVRATPGSKKGDKKDDKKAFIVQSRFNGKAIRITIADAGSITLEDARHEAKRLLLMIEQGTDPREQKRQIVAEQEEVRAARGRQDSEEKVRALMVADVWAEYIANRKPHWGEPHYQCHIYLSQAGGIPVKRGQGLRKPGPLAPLMHQSLADLTTERIEAWLSEEAPSRPTQAALSLRLLKTFLNWCADHEKYKVVISPGIITRKIAAILPKKRAKSDCLQREQLAGWFKAVHQIGNPVHSACLQTLLLTGGRREEVAGLRWRDIDFKWKSITIHDKVEGQRIIPLTPYIEHLFKWLPRRNEWVFSSPMAASGRLQEPSIQHKKALAIAGIDGLTIHGLRRSFGTLSEWVEVPVGIVAQIMGHKPSAIAEKHYRVRPLDLLRMWHVKIEGWILEQAGIEQPAADEAEKPLRVVNGGRQ